MALQGHDPATQLLRFGPFHTKEDRDPLADCQAMGSVVPHIEHKLALSALAHATFVFGGLLLYVIVTRVRRQRRQPSVAYAWVLTMFFLPYLGIPLFLLFGTRKLVPPDFPLPTQPPVDAGLAPIWAGPLLGRFGIAPPTRNKSVRFHADGEAARAALLDMIDVASERIVLSSFILGADSFGQALVGRLTRRAHAGVKVRVLLDSLAWLRCTQDQLRTLRAAGIVMHWATSRRRHPLHARVNLRYHRKLVVCDGASLWCGGRNFAGEYFTNDGDAPPWEDLSFDVHGPLAMQAERMFEHDWRAVGGAPVPLTHVPAQPGDIPAQLLPSGPDYTEDNLYALLLAATYNARRRIVMVTPYFVPDDALLAAWHMACLRGVRLTLLTPARSNHRLADLARRRPLRELCASGADIYFFPRMIHAKAIVIDHSLALCGSANLDGRSLFLNYELMIAFFGQAEVAWLAHWILERVGQSTRYRAHQPSWWRDLAEGLVRVIGFQL